MGARMHSVDTETRHGAGSCLRSLENRIRERAYEVWTAHGCIHGQADQHWLAAEREILTESTATLAGVQQKRRFRVKLRLLPLYFGSQHNAEVKSCRTGTPRSARSTERLRRHSRPT